MDRLPEQHLDSLPDWKRSEVYRQIGSICAFRSQELPEVEVAKKAKFDSVEDMSFRLKRWGLSGLVPLEEHALLNSPVPEGTPAHKARSSSPPQEVPSASAAADLFSEALD